MRERGRGSGEVGGEGGGGREGIVERGNGEGLRENGDKGMERYVGSEEGMGNSDRGGGNSPTFFKCFKSI